MPQNIANSLSQTCSIDAEEWTTCIALEIRHTTDFVTQHVQMPAAVALCSIVPGNDEELRVGLG